MSISRATKRNQGLYLMVPLVSKSAVSALAAALPSVAFALHLGLVFAFSVIATARSSLAFPSSAEFAAFQDSCTSSMWSLWGFELEREGLGVYVHVAGLEA